MSDISDDLQRLAQRLSVADYDARTAVLDLSADLLALNAASLTDPAASELRDLQREVLAVQPVFPSRRNTSPLFDRAGMGQAGRRQAEQIVQRLRAIARMARENPRC